MRFLSRIVASSSVLSIALLLAGLNGTAMSQTETPSGGKAGALPGVLVEAPKQIATRKPKLRETARSAQSLRTTPTTPTSSASPLSPAAQLSRVGITGSCVDGCVTSFRSGNKPWVGCSLSGGSYSSTCRNIGNYKTYNECRDALLILGWMGSELVWYCGSLALN